jgi:hypothetical protein
MTVEQNTELEAAATAQFQAQAALAAALARLDKALAPYQDAAEIPAGRYALVAGSHVILVKNDDGTAGVEQLPLLSEAIAPGGAA